MYTTLNKIRACEPCTDGWKKLLKHLGKTEADNEPLNIKDIVKSNGLDDAVWCLQSVDGKDQEIRLFAVWCARQVQHLMTDQRSLDALDVAERFANGLASEEELMAARDAAEDAAGDTVCAAVYAAWDTAAAAVYAASDAAVYAASDAAVLAARNAAQVDAKAAQAKKLIESCEE